MYIKHQSTFSCFEKALRVSTSISSDVGRDPVRHPPLPDLRGETHEFSPRPFWEGKAGSGSALGSASQITGGDPTERNQCPPAVSGLLWEENNDDCLTKTLKERTQAWSRLAKYKGCFKKGGEHSEGNKIHGTCPRLL